ncbi:MAG: H-NS histone family protein [Pseudomonadota bacterium]
MGKIDLGGMSKADLQKLRKDVDKAIDSFDERARQDALAKLEIQAKELGFSLAELTGARKQKSVNPPKYRNPADPSQTWTGRGRQPQWIKDAVGKGESIESFAI